MLRNDSSAIGSGGFRHIDLELDVGRTPLGRSLEGLDRPLEIEGRRYQRLEVDLAGANQVERALVHIGVTEDRLDPQLLARSRREC